MKAVFKLPYEEDFLWIEDEQAGQQSVSFVSFDSQLTFNLSNIAGLQRAELSQLKKEIFEVKDFPVLPAEFVSPSQSEYLKKIEAAKDFIIEKQLPKIVLSRPVLKVFPNIKLAQTFLNICQKYNNTLCYIFFSDNAIWMGATPEILGQFDKTSGEFTTISLAGTLPLKEEWTDKELMEQNTVTDYIYNILQKYAPRVHYSDPYNHFSRNIKHLRTDFNAIIKEEDVQRLIDQLHPTPAVCGIPKDVCQNKIFDLEQYDRELYSGYIRLETKDTIYYFVNLRCAKIYENKIVAFAGGGITHDSIPQKEWRETELKSEVILRNLA